MGVLTGRRELGGGGRREEGGVGGIGGYGDVEGLGLKQYCGVFAVL